MAHWAAPETQHEGRKRIGSTKLFSDLHMYTPSAMHKFITHTNIISKSNNYVHVQA